MSFVDPLSPAHSWWWSKGGGAGPATGKDSFHRQAALFEDIERNFWVEGDGVRGKGSQGDLGILL